MNVVSTKHRSKANNFDFEDEIRIVLIGKTGSGKSATGNTILGFKAFFSMAGGGSVTSKCTRSAQRRFDKQIHIVDTPGLFDTRRSNAETQEEIVRCIGITAPGPHAFILVINATNRFTEEEQSTVDHFVGHFGENLYDYLIVLFTRKDDLDADGRSVREYIQTAPAHLQEILRKANSRYIAFNNRLTGRNQEEQVLELLSMIQQNIERNGGRYYTDEFYRRAEEKLRIREEEIRKEREKEKMRYLQEYNDKFQAEIAPRDRQIQEMQNQMRMLQANNQQNQQLQEQCRRAEDERNRLLQEQQQLKQKYDMLERCNESAREKARKEIEEGTGVWEVLLTIGKTIWKAFCSLFS